MIEDELQGLGTGVFVTIVIHLLYITITNIFR